LISSQQQAQVIEECERDRECDRQRERDRVSERNRDRQSEETLRGILDDWTLNEAQQGLSTVTTSTISHRNMPERKWSPSFAS
jgi:hypothetical protein